MRKKTYDRMLKKIHQINESPLSTPIVIKKLSDNQPNYNSKLREWYGDKQWDIITEAFGIIDAFKESETWHEAGMIEAHDYKLSINNNLNLILDDITNYIVERLDNNKIYEITFYREFIGEVHIGLRPVIK